MDTVDARFSWGTNGVTDSIGTDSIRTQQPTLQRKPLAEAYAALLAFMFIYCARPEDWIPGLSHAPMAKVAGILAFIAFLLSIRHIRQRFPNEVFYLALLIGQLFLASMFSPVWRGGAIQSTLAFAKVLIIIVVLAVAVNTPRRLRLLIFTHAASVAAIAAITLWRGHTYDGRLNGLLGGNYGDPNDLALAFVISLPMCFALLFLTKSLIWKAAWTAAILVMTYAIFRTGSRGGFLALIVTGAIFLWEFAIRGRRPYLLVFAALVGVIIPISSSRTVVRRFQETFNPSSETSSAHASSEERKELFWRSVDVTKEHPIFGVGPDNFIQLSGNWHVAHNSYTQLSAEGGIPALILYVLILCCGFKNIRKAKRLAGRSKESAVFAKALHASLIGYMAGSFFLSVSYGFFPYFLVAYTTALFLIAKKSGVPLRRLEAPRQAISAESSLGSGQVVELSLNPS